jgi:mannose-6-phosphate isomerase
MRKVLAVTIERARRHCVQKPWGSLDLRPWDDRAVNGAAIGEIWFERHQATSPEASLLLKLLFTSQPLSIQVHPDDAFARSIGLPNGKSEAWYVLSASPGAKVAVGLKRRISASQLRTAIEDGSIAGQVQWRRVEADDVVTVAAGTIHAIGAGLVIAEIQQRSDTTFRLFDYGRQRGLDTDKAVAAAEACPAEGAAASRRLSDERTLLAASPYFVLERIDLRPGARWELLAPRETWILVLSGSARIGRLDAAIGDGLFMEADRAGVTVGPDGLKVLVAYPGPDPEADLLRLGREHAVSGATLASGIPPLSAEAVPS